MRNQQQLEGSRLVPDHVNQPEGVGSAAVSAPHLDLAKTRRPWFRQLKIWLLARFDRRQAALQVLRGSSLFDAPWYLKSNPDVAAAQMSPWLHYLEYGANEGRDPGPRFSTAAYLKHHPSLEISGINPLLHLEGYADVWRRPHQAPITDDRPTDTDRAAIRAHIVSLPHQPLLSVLMPVYDPPADFLRQAINSVQAQLYQTWELCIADDASTDPAVAVLLGAMAKGDKRIKLIHRSTNGNISASSNSALGLATGEFVALMDHDDLLHETALYEVAVEINRHPDADLIYSDEDIVDDHGKRTVAYHKTDFNPELFLGQNMISHFGVYRRSLLKKIGGFRVGFEGSQDYDLALRAWRASAHGHIRHIPAVLYHWRHSQSAPGFSNMQLEKCVAAARRAIQEFLDQEGEGARVVAAADLRDFSRVIRQIPGTPPLVSIIVPTRDRADLLAVCAHGILNKTAYPHIELLIIDHESCKPETAQLFDKLKSDPRVRVLPHQGSFNYSAINNMAVANARGSILALVNNDIEIIEPGWLSEMVSHAVRSEVGAVGAKLIYRTGKVQHAGVVIGFGGVAGHAFHAIDRNGPGYFGQAKLTRAVSAVTGACLVVRKALYQQVGGLNADHLPVAFNDVDLCLKIQEAGYRNVWTPFAELVHHESVSRGREDTPEKKARSQREVAYMAARWPSVIANDPFYSPNLALDGSSYRPARPSRRVRPWSHLRAQEPARAASLPGRSSSRR